MNWLTIKIPYLTKEEFKKIISVFILLNIVFLSILVIYNTTKSSEEKVCQYINPDIFVITHSFQNNHNFIVSVYHDVLDRYPDGSGIDTYEVRALDGIRREYDFNNDTWYNETGNYPTMTRKQVVEDILNSPERRDLCYIAVIE